MTAVTLSDGEGADSGAESLLRRHIGVVPFQRYTNCWPPSMSYVAPVSAVLVMM